MGGLALDAIDANTNMSVGRTSIQEQKPSKHGEVGNGASLQGTKATYNAAPRTTTYEFMGPPGAFIISLLVIFFTYFFGLACDERGCPPLPFVPYMKNGIREMQTSQFWIELWDGKAALAYVGWYTWTVVCWAVLPGKWVEGSQLRNGERLLYKINGTQ